MKGSDAGCFLFPVKTIHLLLPEVPPLLDELTGGGYDSGMTI